MITPIIDPSTLTEEQRKTIYDIYKDSSRVIRAALNRGIGNALWQRAEIELLKLLFGEGFFKKGE